MGTCYFCGPYCDAQLAELLVVQPKAGLGGSMFGCGAYSAQSEWWTAGRALRPKGKVRRELCTSVRQAHEQMNFGQSLEYTL
jgi:hypothetical protein